MDEGHLQEELRRTRQELLLLYEIGNLIRTTLHLDEVLYLILSAVTSHEGLGYNRALLFLVDKSGTALEGRMAIGPTHPEGSRDVWKRIEENEIRLEGLLDVYHKAGKKIDVELNEIVRSVKMPIERGFGILPQTVITNEPTRVGPDDARHELCDPKLIGLGIQEFAVVPLRGKDRVVGVMLIDNVSTGKSITGMDLRRLLMLADHAGLAVENATTFSEIVITAQQDSLTKLWNHGHFQKLLQESMRDAGARGRPISLVVFDVDNFKEYNDAFGHPAGDDALEAVSRIGKTVMRRMDNLARYGGEEFAAVLPDTGKAEAMKLAGRLRDAIEKQTAVEAGFKRLRRKITVSVGVASFPEDAEDKDKLIYCADGALYDAKRAGKNTVRAYRKPAAIGAARA